MKNYLLIITVLILGQINAQTGIGTTTPHASAKLEVNATNKGFLPPRVALTATNSASPITSPANGLMVFNTASAGASPFNVVPGYYYWDGIGLKWVSLSTTVGNVQNQAIFRSSSNTAGYTVVSTWDARFNNIAAGDLTITSNTSFALSNGVYKIQWGLPYQSSQTYNAVQLQENVSGTWGAWRGDANLAGLANGGGTDWGGTTFMTDYIDCSAATRTLRFYNPDSRTLYYGASFIITKLNPSITTSTTADNLGDHTATKNVLLNGNYISNDGDNEGIRIDNSGKVGIGTITPGTSLHIQNGNTFGADPDNTASPSLYVYNTNNASTTAHSTAVIRTNGSGGGNPYLAFDISGIRGYSIGIDNADSDKLKFHSNWNLNNSVTPAMTITNENRIGIGTNSPEAALHVASSVSQYVTSYGFLNTGGSGAGTYNVNVLYSIKADQRIRASEFNAISDARIKKDIFKLNTEKQLEKLNQLNVVNYSYIDQLVNGNKLKTGFIAQEVEQVNPQFVNQSNDFIPSVFALAQSVSINEDLLQLTTEKPHGFEKGDLVKLYAQGKKEFILRIEEVRNSQSFSVKGWNESLDNIFIYGKQVKDFRAIDFDQITALSVGAIQELSKQVKILKLENESLQKRISNEVQKKQSEIEKRLLKLESKLNKK